MDSPFQFKPSHQVIKDYYAELNAYRSHEVTHEGATSSAFQNLLAATCKKADWHLVPQLPSKIRGKLVRPDGTLRDDFNLHRGYWEAKDSADKLDIEIRKKIKLGYPLTNTIFEDTATAVLFQNGAETEPRYDLTKPQELCDLLNKFYSHIQPDIVGFEEAIEQFKERVPELALKLKEKIDAAHKDNRAFQAAFESFFDLCRQSLNPNLSPAAVDEMLIQHLLTIRLFDTIFNNPDFVRRNVIAAEVEKVIDALASKSFSRESFLKSLDRFYVAIESASRVLGEDFTEKQHFLNTVYERFFQGYSVKVADTHGIVYTPQEIVDFMCASVEEVLKTEFGTTLGSKDVHILDPCTGTGNFIVNLIRRVPKRDLPRVYRNQLFANEVMLLPYYIAALNIEHAYFERTGEYEPFEGLCFADTLDLAEKRQQEFGFMTERNTERVEKQKATPITVIIGNPPYNSHQLDENDNNKNRKYAVIDTRIKTTYAKDSNASLKSKGYDPYAQFVRWATDRLGDQEGIICFITNNSFVHKTSFDGMRKHLLEDFSTLYHLDLNGNVKLDPKLAGSVYNVFGIQVGVGITIALSKRGRRKSCLFYESLPKVLRKEEKLARIAELGKVSSVGWQKLSPDKHHSWLVPENGTEFDSFLAIGSKEGKAGSGQGVEIVFQHYSLGVGTNRDEWVYDFAEAVLSKKMKTHIQNYNFEVLRFSQESPRPQDISTFLNNDPRFLKWTDRLKDALQQGQTLTFDKRKIKEGVYRPFTKMWLYFDHLLNQRRYQQHRFFPEPIVENENRQICVSAIANEKPFYSIVVDSIPNLAFVGFGGGCQCFPFYVYDKDGTNRRENITDWALEHFREHYKNKKINKWDIFYYVYGLLYHPGFRSKFADNLKRELPRIPLAPDFKAFAKAGKKLADLHLNYERLEPWTLKWIEAEGMPLSYHVKKMRLSNDKTQLKVNESLTLAKIPPAVFEYRLGNRSALDWVIDQYQISTDRRSGIVSDPNNPDDPEYIVRLVGQVVHVSVETVKIVNSLPAEFA